MLLKIYFLKIRGITTTVPDTFVLKCSLTETKWNLFIFILKKVSLNFCLLIIRLILILRETNKETIHTPLVLQNRLCWTIFAGQTHWCNGYIATRHFVKVIASRPIKTSTWSCARSIWRAQSILEGQREIKWWKKFICTFSLSEDK